MKTLNLSRIAASERAVTLFFLLLSILGGLYAFLSLGRAEDPSFTVRVMVVSAQWPGATVNELEEQVVDRLEKRIQEVENLYRIETTIRPGRADLQVEFHDYTPSERLPELFYEVRKRMWDEQGRMPPGVIGPLVNDDFSDVYFGLLAITAPGLPMRELTREAEALRDRLKRVEGVQKALLLGERPQRILIEFDNAELANLGLSPNGIFDAIEAHNRLLPSGQIETAGPRLYLRLDNALASLDELRAVPIRAGDRLIRLGDIARVRHGYEDPPGFLIRAEGQDALVLGIVMAEGTNGLELGERLADFVERERAVLPLGMELEVLNDQSEAIGQAVSLFQLKFLIAVLVVMLVSFLAIGWRAGLIVGIAIPVTLGLTFMLMQLAGMNLDRITLGALIIALGLLVDDAIIAIEMMLVKMEEGLARIDAAAFAWRATAAPMLFGTLVTVAGFVPIGFARSGVGEYAGNIFWVLAFALLVSWVVAVTFTPYLGAGLLPERGSGESTEAQAYRTPLYRRLRRWVEFCVTHGKLVLLATFLALVLAVLGMVGPVAKQFFPGSDRPEVIVSVFMPPGTAIGVTDRTVRRLETLLAEREDVRSLSAYVGAGAPRFFISANPEQPDPAFAKLVAVAEDADARDRIMADLNRVIAEGAFPEARVRVSRLLYGPPVVWPLVFRVVGEDPERLRSLADELRQKMLEHPNVVDPHLEWNERVPVAWLDLDHERLRLIGLTPRSVAEQLEFQSHGLAIGEIRQDIRSVQLRVQGLNEDGPIDPMSLELKTEDGRKVALAQLGRLRIRFEQPVIKRYNRQPFVAVQADIRGAQPNDVTGELWADLADLRSSLPPGYRIDIGGSVEQSGKADASIQKLMPLMVALMLIFIMLQMRSFKGMAVVVATAPLGLIGAVLALLLFRQPFGFVALLGLIGLAGILMRNTLILTQQVADNLADGQPAREAIVEAAVRRARPVVLTALAAALAFVPLTLDSFWGPLAFVLIGGVIVGTAITLLFVPALYAVLMRPERA
ncbi:efflux RND transporter permease subunit [Wenzhouxiangella marina]|uniref:RND superfamily efflux transporter subunit n=1 Tax=Wenzhouxiangella marina TaxID=1579979 RepID=A0A0K0XWH4_9GAMM|nr:efflux RND transporter permease subunit [Wenzhouxiangella marina]AKS42054.1 RND superfamily efflux transporter subunit [Wenzhouxiangella marina]MBB6086177.1 multidrug efflux pump subunit AcrB [Wenzhouxiangella marina]